VFIQLIENDIKQSSSSIFHVLACVGMYHYYMFYDGLNEEL